MKVRFLSGTLAVAAFVGVISLVFVSRPAAQNAAPAVKPSEKPTPRLSNGRPDFSGFYGGKHGDEQRGALSSTLAKANNGSIYFDYGGANDGASYPALEESKNQPPYKPEYM